MVRPFTGSLTAVLVLSSRRLPSALLGAPLLGLPRPKHMPQSPCQRCPRTRGTVGSVLASPHHSLVPDSVVHSEVSRHHRGGSGLLAVPLDLGPCSVGREGQHRPSSEKGLGGGRRVLTCPLCARVPTGHQCHPGACLSAGSPALSLVG